MLKPAPPTPITTAVLSFKDQHALTIALPLLLGLVCHEARQLPGQRQKHRQGVIGQLGTFHDAVVGEHDGAVSHCGVPGEKELIFHARAERLHPAQLLCGLQVGGAERSADKAVGIGNLSGQIRTGSCHKFHLRRNPAARLQLLHHSRALDHNLHSLCVQ